MPAPALPGPREPDVLASSKAGLCPRDPPDRPGRACGGPSPSRTGGNPDPQRSGHRRRREIPRREGRTLTPGQAQAFLSEVKGDRLEAAYVVALALGLRRGELLGISWGDLRLDGPMPLVRIRRQLLRHSGQGVLLAELKTAGSRRTLYLSQPLVDPAGHRTRQNAERKQLASGATPPTWCSPPRSAPRSIRRPSVGPCREFASGRPRPLEHSRAPAFLCARSCLRWACRWRSCPTRSGTPPSASPWTCTGTCWHHHGCMRQKRRGGLCGSTSCPTSTHWLQNWLQAQPRTMPTTR